MKPDSWLLRGACWSGLTALCHLLGDTFAGDCGAFWCWRHLDVPAHPCRDGRYLLRFWDVDYLADVWVNGTRVGSHEGSMSPFVFDVTGAVAPGSGTRIAVRAEAYLDGKKQLCGIDFWCPAAEDVMRLHPLADLVPIAR